MNIYMYIRIMIISLVYNFDISTLLNIEFTDTEERNGYKCMYTYIYI
jgi:hypothetical protein